MEPAEYEALGLYDPSSPDAADRLALLEFLGRRGVSIERMTEWLDAGRITALAAEAVILGGKRELTLEEVASQAGMSAELAERVARASGFPPVEPGERFFSAADVAAFWTFNVGLEMFGEEPLLQFTRVLGSSLARLADAAVSLFLVNVEAPLAEVAGSELVLAGAVLHAIQALEETPRAMDVLFRHHLEAAIHRSTIARENQRSYDTAFLAVGFVDLVGYTPLSLQLSPRELADLVTDFESRAQDVVTMQEGRIVKLIGDEVMFVAVDAARACDVALTIVEMFAADARGVSPRGGVAFGELLARGGDYYGPVVNLAARIADLAVPHEILVTHELRERAAGAAPALRFEPAGRRMLKGFSDPVELFAVSR